MDGGRYECFMIYLPLLLFNVMQECIQYSSSCRLWGFYLLENQVCVYLLVRFGLIGKLSQRYKDL